MINHLDRITSKLNENIRTIIKRILAVIPSLIVAFLTGRKLNDMQL